METLLYVIWIPIFCVLGYFVLSIIVGMVTGKSLIKRAVMFKQEDAVGAPQQRMLFRMACSSYIGLFKLYNDAQKQMQSGEMGILSLAPNVPEMDIVDYLTNVDKPLIFVYIELSDMPDDRFFSYTTQLHGYYGGQNYCLVGGDSYGISNIVLYLAMYHKSFSDLQHNLRELRNRGVSPYVDMQAVIKNVESRWWVKNVKRN